MAKKSVKKSSRGGKRPGSGRPPAEEPMVVVNFRVPLSVKTTLKKEARDADLDLSTYLRDRLGV